MSINTKTLLAATALAFTAASANAAIIAEYTFTGGSTASTPGTLGSSIGFEAGITGSSTASDDLRITGGETLGGENGGPDYEDVDQDRIATANWVTFTIAVSATQEIGLTSLDFDYTEIDPAAFLLGVYTSKTGFTEGDHLLGIFDSTTTAGPLPNTTFTDNNGTSVNLSGITALQGLTDETVEFRFLLGDSSGSSSRIHVLDDIVLNGDVTVVPEPSTTALIGLGGIALILRRRK
jgi:hypothetical protein